MAELLRGAEWFPREAKLWFMIPPTLISYTHNNDVNFIEINAGEQKRCKL